jgi:hypothetical protein
MAILLIVAFVGGATSSAIVAGVAREVTMAAFDVVVTPLLLHAFDVFFIGTTVGRVFGAEVFGVVAFATASEFDGALVVAVAVAVADVGFEIAVIGKVGEVGFLYAVDGRYRALFVLTFSCIAGFDTCVQVGWQHVLDGIAEGIFICSPFFAVEGAEEGMNDALVGPFLLWFEMVLNLFNHLGVRVDVVAHGGTIILRHSRPRSKTRNSARPARFDPNRAKILRSQSSFEQRLGY